VFKFTVPENLDPKAFVEQLVSDFDMPDLDLSRLDPTRFDLTRLDVRNVDLPSVELPDIDVDRIAGLARDAAYVAIGTAVIVAQKTDAARRELTDQISDQISAAVRPLIDATTTRLAA
jgi:hypothetical protein